MTPDLHILLVDMEQVEVGEVPFQGLLPTHVPEADLMAISGFRAASADTDRGPRQDCVQGSLYSGTRYLHPMFPAQGWGEVCQGCAQGWGHWDLNLHLSIHPSC